MANVNVYLTFDGNCEEAFKFYRSVFGGEFTYLGRFSEMPKEEGMPELKPEMANRVMHVSLPIGKSVLMGSDSGDWGPKLVVGNNFSISVNADSKEEADKLYKALSAGGKESMPMGETFWGAYFGMLTDKFGINWMINKELRESK